MTLYEALTLALPFEGDTDEKLITEILTGHYIPARKRNKHISRDLETIMMKATHLDADKRYQTANEFGEDLQRWLDGMPVVARRDGLTRRSLKWTARHRGLLLSSLVTVMVVAAPSAYFFVQQKEELDLIRAKGLLEHALDAKISPFDFAPEWDALSETVYRRIGGDELDTTTILFYQISSLIQSPNPYIGKFDQVEFKIGYRSLDLFDYWSELHPPDSRFAVVTDILLAHEHRDYELAGTISSEFGRIPPRRCTLKGNLSDLLGLDSLIFINSDFYVKTETRVYMDAGIFRRIDTFELNTGVNFLVSSEGDSLIRVVSSRDPIILGINDLSPVEPVYTQTSYDSIGIGLFNEYPGGLPRMISDSRMQRRLPLAFSPSEIRVHRFTDGYLVLFSCRIMADSITVPLAFQFSITERGSPSKILSGGLRVRPSDGLDGLDFDVAYGTGGPGGTTTWNGTLIEHSLATGLVGIHDSILTGFAKRGPIPATMTLRPSIDVARLFGDIYEFLDDPLTMDITFQVFDSSGVTVDQ